MKEELTGKLGFSTLEIVIAVTIISVVITGVINSNFSGQKWIILTSSKIEAGNINKNILNKLINESKINFYNSTTSKESICNEYSNCYDTEIKTKYTSSCFRENEITTFWKTEGSATSSIKNKINLINTEEIIKLGGDCNLDTPSGDWRNNIQELEFIENTPGKRFTELDVLNEYIYVTSNSSPSFHIYKKETSENPISLINSYDLKINELSVNINALDAIREISTGRIYVFLAIATTTKQLAVIDVTEPTNPEIKNQITLNNVPSFGSFPQGYKIYAYSNRLYILTRETAGYELHIFNIDLPESPTEIGNGFELNRTINDIYVRDQKINGETKRLMFLASDSNLKEFSILDVTDDNAIEMSSINLLGNQDGLSLSLDGNLVYFGRSNNTSGPELYAFDITNPASVEIIAQAELGSNINNIRSFSDVLFITTNRLGENFQVWNKEYWNWNPSFINSGRISYYNFPNIPSFGIDANEKWLFLINNILSSDRISILKTQ